MFRLSRQFFGISRFSRPNVDISCLSRRKVDIFRLYETETEIGQSKKRDQKLVQTFATDISHLPTLVTKIFSKMETAQSAYAQLRKRRDQLILDFSDQGGCEATFQTNAEMAQLSRTRRRRRNFPEQGGDSATKKQIGSTFATDVSYRFARNTDYFFVTFFGRLKHA